MDLRSLRSGPEAISGPREQRQDRQVAEVDTSLRLYASAWSKLRPGTFVYNVPTLPGTVLLSVAGQVCAGTQSM